LSYLLNYFIFELVKKNIWANFQRIIERFTQNIVIKLSRNEEIKRNILRTLYRSFLQEYQQRAAFQTTEVKELVSTLPLGTVFFGFSLPLFFPYLALGEFFKNVVHTPSGMRIRDTLLRIRIRLLTCGSRSCSSSK
jgi:hypothetical protein